MDTIYLCFMYKVTFIIGKDNPIIKINKVFHVLEGLGNLKSLYDKAKYTNYIGDKLKMDIVRSLTHMGATIFNVFGEPNLCTPEW